MTLPFSLSPEQRDQFLADGAVRVPGAIPDEAVEAMAARIWAVLSRQLGYVRDHPETWTDRLPTSVMRSLIQMADTNVFAGMLSARVRALLDDFFDGRGWHLSAHDPRPLGVNFPTPHRPWNVPTRSWHLDRVENDVPSGRPAAVADCPWPGSVRLFAYLSVVEPGGGGTFYVSGSHRAVNLLAAEMRPAHDRIPSAKLVDKLKGRSRWIAELCSKGEEGEGRVRRFMHEGTEFRGISLRVSEMTGQPGDVILWHPNLLHTVARANSRETPRMVLSATIDAEIGEGWQEG